MNIVKYRRETSFELVIIIYIDKSGWPSGLRRCVQVAVQFSGRGFKSHF